MVKSLTNNRDRASMLFKGRLEAMFYDEMSAQYLLASNPLLNDKYAIRFTLQGSPVYWGVSYRFVSNEVREALNRAWHYMLEHNMIEPVYLKYGLHIDVQQLTNFPVLLLNSENK
jgi:ABC-type amino acid transport substrate-binding protein